MKINLTIICLTVITIAALFTPYVVVPIVLWFGYGLYRVNEESD